MEHLVDHTSDTPLCRTCWQENPDPSTDCHGQPAEAGPRARVTHLEKHIAVLSAALRDSLQARIDAAKKRSHEEIHFCARCGRTCEILHKARTLEFDDSKRAYFHDAHDEDCWEQEKAAHAALSSEGKGWVSPEVRERVQKWAADIDYYANELLSRPGSKEAWTDLLGPVGIIFGEESRAALAALEGK